MRLGILALAVLFGLPQIMVAGPPLICHAFDIGQAKSLPWTSPNWNLSGQEAYNINRLVDDTVARLTPDTSPLVRMETLRRATLYSQKNLGIAQQLLAKLRSRAQESDAQGRPDALAWFDLGYLVETFHQANWLFEKAQEGTTDYTREKKPNPSSGMDGYAMIEKAIKLRGNDPQMEFAAALISLGGSSYPGHQEHLQKALDGAKADLLLAKNLSTHFIGAEGVTMAEMFKQRQGQD
jgi:hypothetical protein